MQKTYYTWVSGGSWPH